MRWAPKPNRLLAPCCSVLVINGAGGRLVVRFFSIERTVNDSGIFRTVLTPKNDPKSHHDHFHLEANPDYSDLDDKPAS